MVGSSEQYDFELLCDYCNQPIPKDAMLVEGYHDEVFCYKNCFDEQMIWQSERAEERKENG